MMEGVVLRGTAAGAGFQREIGKPIAGKTGTTNDEKDVWFVGFAPDLAVGVYLGYDKPRHIANRASGGSTAAPIVKEFMKQALAEKPGVPFRVPPGLKLVRVDPKSGTRIAAGSSGGILEAFKPGTSPPDSYSVSYEGQQGEPGRPSFFGITPEADRAVSRGGLY